MFQPVNSRVNFPQVEERISALWKDNNIFQKSIDQRQGAARFTLYEGPPTANARPGIHHVMPRAFKDIMPRYKAMKGFYAPRIGGWDTHGLPVELEVEKMLGFSGKAQIEEYGIELFNQKCRENVFSFIKEWEEMTDRIAFWVDLDNAYVTMNNDYIESVWWAIKQMWDKDLVYQGYRVTPHCPRCETSLSSHEVAQGYQDDVEDPSVYIKFKVAEKASVDLPGDKPAYLLAWTTTPWTLPGNTALAVAAEAEYSVVEIDNEYLILASARLGALELDEAKVVHKFMGSDLQYLAYQPLFNPHVFGMERQRFQNISELKIQDPDQELAYPVIKGDFVSMEDGTGIVHIAPAYGEADYEAGQDNNLDFVHHVDLRGQVTGSYPFSGKFVKDADPLVLEDLEKRGLLYRSDKTRHTYPFCWRCDAPLLYYAKQTWYIRTTAVKERLISGNSEINWYPEHIKHGRFGDWLNNNIDWAFSRERYWGTPLPVWQCQFCGTYDCIGGLDDLKGKAGFSGVQEPLDLHRPFIDDVTYKCPECGDTMRRVPEVIDVWFDSGAMPIAQSHYPFENAGLLEDGRFPANYICEAIDQTRGWFYSLHAISTLLFDRPSYMNVICHGHILDAKGEKMSKSKGNAVDLWGVIDKHGADALRWYFFTAVALGNSMRFDEQAIVEISRRFLMTLWNVYSFFVTYANIDNFVPDSKEGSASQSELDRWILSELNQLIIEVDSALDNYDPRGGARPIAAFVDNLSNWYVRRSRRRFWKSESDADKLSAYNTLYECLVTLSKLMAPFTPFLAEELYQNLVSSVSSEAPESVHLADFPLADEKKIDGQLSEANRLAMKVSSLGRTARSKAGIKVRQPLPCLFVRVSSGQKSALKRLESQVMEEVNTKTLELVDDADLVLERLKGGQMAEDGGVVVVLDTELSLELEAEGMAREVVHRLQTMRRSAGFEISDHIATYYQADDYVREVMSQAATADYIKQETLSRELVEGLPPELDLSESFKLNGHEVQLAIKKQE
ncbi:MAG: isoleucine--tRNA ligase [Dehalococcoidales bacterium]|jgi:isoleucyl-tRNA synthetase|nr:isoleucine--tRNA ligase [Dehalococcoidales bacterium]